MFRPAFLLAPISLAISLIFTATLQVAADDPPLGVAQMPKAMSVAELSQLKGNIAVATGLVRIGQSQKDAHALLVALRILSGIGADVALPQSAAPGKRPQMYDLEALAAEARTYAAGNQDLLNAIAAIDATKPQNYCYWAWECNDVYCDRYYICTSD
jgi:hypothetical protein